MDSAHVQAHERFTIRQKMTLMTKEYVVTAVRPDGSEGEVVAFAHQKRMTLSEQMTFYTGESKEHVLCAFEARELLDPEAGYDVRDAAGRTIGSFRNEAVASLLRSTWSMRQPGTVDLTGRERNRVVAGVRRAWEWLPFTDFVPFLWPYHFDFTEGGKRLMAVDKKFGLRDRYVLDILAPGLDRRLAIAQAVALDALEER
ncbi:hypothetical protein E0500_024945 [Streptomyces sp. KM273126]|uniref:hypothetical protein n=1 Tax=Streptomyces sp. KM273126 TaxID=2545247 RepID=UPI00103C28D9|nr:hypothetical protein [Streptomyces sp. KM273126]MBA2810554.1 hypothetical protein [Streptomyces sp. KM273126]